MSLLTTDASNSRIAFGSPSDSRAAQIKWNFNAKLFEIGTTTSNGEISFNTADDSAAVRIDSSGNVGIGTASPNALLHVSGGNILLDNNKQLLSKNTAGHAKNLIYMDNGDTMVIGDANSAGTDAIRFDIANIEGAMFIEETTGDVGIGTTNPSYDLDVAGDVRVQNKLYVSHNTPTYENVSTGTKDKDLQEMNGMCQAGKYMCGLKTIEDSGDYRLQLICCW